MTDKIKINADGSTKSSWIFGAKKVSDETTQASIKTTADVLTPVEIGSATAMTHALTLLQNYTGQLCLPVTAQSTGAPTTTGVIHYAICTTAGAGGSVGDLFFDDATNVTKLTATSGRVIWIESALSGGTLELAATSFYRDVSGTWTLIESTSGQVNAVKVSISTSSVDSTTVVPNNAYITKCQLIVDTAYTAAATIKVGTTGDDDLLIATTDFDITTADTYIKCESVVWSSTSVVKVAIGGTPVAGSATLIIEYALPLT